MSAKTTQTMMTSQTILARTLAILALVLLCLAQPFAQTGTVMPVPKQQFLDNNGNPLASGLLYTYAAGTSTPLATYTDVNLSVANANPVVLDSAGRATVFLTAASYKFELQTSAAVVVWTQDNIQSVAPFNVYLDITGTAGENLAAGDAIYLSDGSGGRTAGRWYRTDADFTYASSEAPFLGVAIFAITSGNAGSVRLGGLVSQVGPLTSGAAYYVSATAGAVTPTAPTNVRVVGTAQSTTTLLVAPFNSYKIPALTSSYVLNPIPFNTLACGRLTLTTGVPITTADVTAATTVYYTPAGQCNQIGLYTTASVWTPRTFAELSIAVPASTNTLYDVFVYDNAGTPALELSAAWNNSAAGTSARHAAGIYASILPAQDGVYVKSTNGTAVDATRRYVGSFRTTGVSGQTEDSFAKRLLVNQYNQVDRELRALEATNTWAYTSAAWQRANAATGSTNQVQFLVGVVGPALHAQVDAFAYNSGGGGNMAVGIGLDTSTAPTTGNRGINFYNASNGICSYGGAWLEAYPSIGYHELNWIEYSLTTTGTTTWCGDNNAPTLLQAGITGRIRG